MYNPQLEAFIRVADAGTFSKAAHETHITPTAIIKQINILEADLGVQLFVRTHRGVKLTEAGKSLYKDAKYLIQYSKDSITRAKNATQGSEHIIRIGTSPMTPTKFLMELWPQIHSLYPELKAQLVPFENTPENAREIMKNFGQNIDLVLGIYDENLLQQRKSAGLELKKIPIRCAMSIHHRLAEKENLSIQDLFGEKLMIIQRGWNNHVDLLRDDIEKNYPQITIDDFQFYNTSVFNQCENSKSILMAIGAWENVHPLLKILPVEWDYVVPVGLIFSRTPSEDVHNFIRAVIQIYELDSQIYGLEC